jgi:hypothetical protein
MCGVNSRLRGLPSLILQIQRLREAKSEAQNHMEALRYVAFTYV